MELNNFLSASEHYNGRKKDKSILEHLTDKYNGYTTVNLNLRDFVDYLDLSMILNNDLISNNYEEWELYNFNELLYNEEEYIEDCIKEDLNDLINGEDCFNYLDSISDIDYIKELLNNNWSIEDIIEELQDNIYDRAVDEVYQIEVYQYFIVPEYEAINYWSEYTNYPIYYSYESDIYLVGITHWGMSWKYFNTTYEYRSYL